MPNWEIIEQHIQNMEEALAQLGKYRNISFNEFQKDLSLVWIVEKGLEILIQNLLDIGAHLLASEIKNDWEDYGEVILKLGKHGVIPQEFVDQIKGMAGLRNILIHEYLRIDLNKLFDYLKYRLEDFVQFIRYIREYQRSSLKK
ncbi:MAG: DUF86 domain-containing protein [Thermodesulfobacteriota bacterium]|jgi:uncharacterized protein YutE (UPF0331/DUF86 family)